MSQTSKKTLTKSKNSVAKLVPGNIITVKITATGLNNVGINEFSYGLPVLVPNANLGDTVQAKILKILKEKKVAIAKLVKVVTNSPVGVANKNLPTLVSGTTLDVVITKLGPNETGIADVAQTYNNISKIIVKKPFIAVGEKLTVNITRLKKDYAFAVANQNNQVNVSVERQLATLKGTKFTVVLPKKAKRYLKHLVFKVNKLQNGINGFEQRLLISSGSTFGNQNGFKQNGHNVEATVNANTILFVKPSLGAKLGDKVQIKITKFFKVNGTLKYNVAIAKIVKLNPISNVQKQALVRASLRQMLKSGMHYGEKAIKCNARMKNYVWTRKKGLKDARPLIKKGRNIINLLKTRRCLNKSLAQLAKYAAKGKTFLFVGTKKAASGLVARAALFSKKAFFVNTRWLGGMLTNWKTILKSISKIRPILKEKQIIIKDILEKRQTIKARLIQKALLLRKKSKLMLKKGKLLIQLLKQTNGHSANNKFIFAERANELNTKRKEIVSYYLRLLEKRQQLSTFVNQSLRDQSQALKAKAIQLTSAYQKVLNNLVNARKKLRELKSLLIISQELHTFKQQTKQTNQNLYMISYNKFKTLNASQTNIINNPPKEILNKMVSIIKGQSLTLKTNNLNLKSTTTKTLVLSQLLSKFNLFVPNIKSAIQNLQNYVSTQKALITSLSKVLNTVKAKMSAYINLKNNLVMELQRIKQTLQTERNIIRVLRRKLKQISAQKRLIKFLPKLRYLPTPATKIEQTARFLMKKFVDPKMKYPMDSIYDEKLSRQSKKVAASRKKKWQRLEKYLGGISNMTKIKEKQISNNVAIIIGQQEEMNAVRECQKLGIKMFHIVDTNCNPGFADHFIPANDDARNSIKYILGKFLTHIRLAQKLKLKLKKSKIKK